MRDSFELPLSDVSDKPTIKFHLIRRLHSGENVVIVQDDGIEYEFWAIESGKYKRKRNTDGKEDIVDASSLEHHLTYSSGKVICKK